QAVARAGYFSRGVVYAIISFFAILASLGAASSKGSEGALATLLAQPFGIVLIGIMACGLAGFSAWRLIQAVMDADNHGHAPRALVVRLALLTSAATYATLAVTALTLAVSLPGSGGSGQTSLGVLDAIVHFAGVRVFATLLSLLFLGIALAHWWKVLTGKYSRHFDEDEAPMRLVHAASVLGLGARGVVFALLAAMVWLGIEGAPSSPSEIPGTQEALRYIQQLPYGQPLLFALAVGLMIFAGYSFIEARWRKVDVSFT
ncbi:MAG: DUF1206 domain-containing protein, partial [Roseibium sp.]